MRQPEPPQLSIDDIIQLVTDLAENPAAAQLPESQAQEILRQLAKHDDELGSVIPPEQLCPAARIDAGEHYCEVLLRPHEDLPGGLWSWSVYIDGNVHRRGPGSTRKDPTPLYAVVFKGMHRVVVRSPFDQGGPRVESNTVSFEVNDQNVVLVNVLWRKGRPFLELSKDIPAWLG